MSSETIFVPLSDEGTDVWVPVGAERLDETRYKIVDPLPDGQNSVFKAGDVVLVEWKAFTNQGQGLVAIQSVFRSHKVFDDWDEVDAEVDRILAMSGGVFDSRTVSNVKEVIELFRKKSVLPREVAKGYWDTIRLTWTEREFEVFEDRVEIYNFHNQKVDIWYEQHLPGGSFSANFINALPRLPSPSQT